MAAGGPVHVGSLAGRVVVGPLLPGGGPAAGRFPLREGWGVGLGGTVPPPVGRDGFFTRSAGRLGIGLVGREAVGDLLVSPIGREVFFGWEAWEWLEWRC